MLNANKRILRISQGRPWRIEKILKFPLKRLFKMIVIYSDSKQQNQNQNQMLIIKLCVESVERLG
jgi:hypothetical protein